MVSEPKHSSAAIDRPAVENCAAAARQAAAAAAGLGHSSIVKMLTPPLHPC